MNDQVKLAISVIFLVTSVIISYFVLSGIISSDENQGTISEEQVLANFATIEGLEEWATRYVEENYNPQAPYIMIFSSRFYKGCAITDFLKWINEDHGNGRQYYLFLHPDYTQSDVENGRIIVGFGRLPIVVTHSKFKEEWDELFNEDSDLYVYSGLVYSVVDGRVVQQCHAVLSGLVGRDLDESFEAMCRQ